VAVEVVAGGCKEGAPLQVGEGAGCSGEALLHCESVGWMQVQGRRQLQAWLPLAGTWTGGPPAGAGVSPPTHLFAAAAAAAVGVSVARSSRPAVLLQVLLADV